CRRHILIIGMKLNTLSLQFHMLKKMKKVAEVKAGCNGCHTPIAFFAGDVPPPRPEFNSRANESVSCDVCHTVSGFKGDVPYNFNFISNPADGKTKYGPRGTGNSLNIKLLNQIF
ncbi:MAG: hypothetical protein M5T52_24240, partial [Ignavibacteriaceae bacterium]|nr:hypothetical protein [Ignavibacteriaceae bacterium]